MPSKPKKRKYTGSKLLGEELKRLRGGRSLEDIADLTRKPPLSLHVAPVAAPTLCQLETGTSMPTLATLYSLSHVYKTSMNQLMGFVIEDRLVETDAHLASLSPAELEAELGRRLASSNWHGALALSIHGERMARTERERVAWRGNRASCLSKVGLHAEAVALMVASAESPALSPRQKFYAFRNLAELHASAGHLTSASLAARHALDLAESASLSSQDVAKLCLTRAGILVDAFHSGQNPDERSLREAIRLAEQAARDWPSAEGDIPLLWPSLVRAQATFLLGNALVAAKELEEILERGARLGVPLAVANALLWLAEIRLTQRRTSEAEQLLRRAVDACEPGGQIDALFEACFALFKLLRGDRPTEAVKYLRRCNELFPLLVSKTPLVLEYEQFSRETA